MDIVPYESWVEYVLLLWEIAETKPRRVLDCACGTGNVSFELARHGFEVTGVDISEAMIEAARQKLTLNALNPDDYAVQPPLSFVCADLAEFELDEKFDAATCLYDSFNYFLDPAKLERAFGQIAKHVVEDGVFVFDMNAPWAFEANLFTQRSRNPRKALHYDWRAHYNAQTRICDVTMQFERLGADGRKETFSEVHRERAYSRAEVTAMLIQTGWQLLKVYDAYTVNPPHDRSERWFFVARRV